MKKITYHFLFLMASTLFFLGCSKEANVEPVADKELQSSIDASFANYIVTDIDMICSFVAENNLYPKFYLPAPGSPTFVVNRDADVKQITISFNKTKCVDGRLRDGTIFLRYAADPLFNPNPPPNTDYYRDFGFIGRVTLSNYKVDGWLVENSPGSTYFLIKNKRLDANRPIVNNISWTIEGNLQFTDSSSVVPKITWKGMLTKTLANMSDTSVFKNEPKTVLSTAVKWPNAKVAYTGSFSGVTSYSVPYSYKIYDATPIGRDFKCFPDKVAGVVLTPTLTPYYEEFHPFVSGIASFTTANLYPREIYFDNAENKYSSGTLNLPAQCDNKGVVQIKGIYYPIDLKK